MTTYTRIFHSDLDNKWYYWDKHHKNEHGPFDTYAEAQRSLTKEVDGKEKATHDKEAQRYSMSRLSDLD